jgi:lysozyme
MHTKLNTALLSILLIELAILIFRINPEVFREPEKPTEVSVVSLPLAPPIPIAPPVPPPVEEPTTNIDIVLAGLIADFESFSPVTYNCPAGKKTIGFGFTEKRYLDMIRMSEEDAWSILIEELIPKYRKIVRQYVRVPLNENQEAALISFTFNCGEGSLKKLVADRLNKGKYSETSKAMNLYVKAKVKGQWKTLEGLVKRRKAESALFNRPEALITSSDPV